MKKSKFNINLIFILFLTGLMALYLTNGFFNSKGICYKIFRDAEIFNDTKEFPHMSSSEGDYTFGWNTTIGSIYEDRAIGVAVDSNDNVYVLGFQDISGTNTNRDMVLVKYNTLGEQQWIRYWGGNNDDLPYDLLIDSSDNIFFVGLTKSLGDIDGDAVIVKYNGTGHQLWNFTWGGDQYDFANAIGIDSSNNFYIGGGSESFGDIDGDAFLVKFDENWIEQWNKTWGGSDTDEVNYLHIDTNDDIYIAGASFSLDPSPGEADAFLNKYNSSGDLQWSESWGGSYGQRALGIATDSLNDVYIVCRTFGHPASSGKGAIVKYNSTGTYQWEEIWGVNGVYNNYMYRIIIDSNDDLYVSGTTYSYGFPNNNDAILFNYDTDGNQNWYKIWSEYEWDLSFDLCMDSHSNIYLAGDSISYSVGQKDMLVLKYKYTGDMITEEITIATPQNRTYTEPDSGYYPATYGFENDLNGGIPEEWEYRLTIPQQDSYIQVIPSLDGHNKVVDMNKGNTYGSHLHLWNNFSDQVYGSVEFWLRTTDVTEGSNFHIQNGDTWVGAISIEGSGFDSSFAVHTEGAWQPINQTANNNHWYHILLQFECGTGNHYNLDQYYFKVIINGVEFGDFRFSSDEVIINQVRILQNWRYDNYHTYIDAIGYSWDPDYNIGDNLKEGLLLSFENTTNLDWQGYSLDGQANKTILGNTTITMPSDGIHHIQVFGNDTMGTMYESEKRYFTVATSAPEITINSPSESEIFGSNAPTYDISISGLYETIWYTLDGGATNITAIGLTGTIDQTEWDKLGDSIVTITFYANNSANVIGSAEVMIIKHVTDGNPPGVPGYNLIAILGVSCVIILLLIKKKFKK